MRNGNGNGNGRGTAATPRSRRIGALAPWFHNLHLPDGSETAPDHPLGDFPAFKWTQLAPHLPQRLHGWRALDIGCNAGFYSFELARRGAEVLGIDIDPHYLAQARWAAREFGLADRVTFRRMQVYDLARSAEQFDLVLFMGVFYHLRYPLLALDIIAQRVRRMMVFQTLTMPGMDVIKNTDDRHIMDRADLCRPGWPKMAFIEHRFAGDPTNWWIANHAAVMALLRSAGFHVRGRPGHEIYLCEPNHAPRQWMKTHGVPELLAATGKPWRGGRGPDS
jgi:tRNA (mo5U34)-methyltransferase